MTPSEPENVVPQTGGVFLLTRPVPVTATTAVRGDSRGVVFVVLQSRQLFGSGPGTPRLPELVGGLESSRRVE